MFDVRCVHPRYILRRPPFSPKGRPAERSVLHLTALSPLPGFESVAAFTATCIPLQQHPLRAIVCPSCPTTTAAAAAVSFETGRSVRNACFVLLSAPLLFVALRTGGVVRWPGDESLPDLRLTAPLQVCFRAAAVGIVCCSLITCHD